MKHFLATRFNLRFEGWTSTKNGNPVLDDKWLTDRFMLFNNFCLPSVLNQSNQNFHWILFFDQSTPAFFKTEIENIISPFKNVYVLFIDGMKDLEGSFKDFIASHTDKDDSFIITTRLDNDDMIHKDFIDTIQNAAYKSESNASQVIDLINGYQLSILNRKYEIREYSNLLNPFLSLKEDIANFDTIFKFRHKEWKSDRIEISNNRLWMEVIHPNNKLNQSRLDLQLTKNFNPEVFGFNTELKKLNFLERSLKRILYKLKTSTKLKVLRKNSGVKTFCFFK